MIRQIVSAAVLSVSLVAPLASHASIFGRTPEATGVNAVKAKMVKLTLKNKSAEAMTVYVDGKATIIAANGGTQDVKVAVGTDILAADQTTVRVHVTSDLGGNTVAFR